MEDIGFRVNLVPFFPFLSSVRYHFMALCFVDVSLNTSQTAIPTSVILGSNWTANWRGDRTSTVPSNTLLLGESVNNDEYGGGEVRNEESNWLSCIWATSLGYGGGSSCCASGVDWTSPLLAETTSLDIVLWIILNDGDDHNKSITHFFVHGGQHGQQVFIRAGLRPTQDSWTL